MRCRTRSHFNQVVLKLLFAVPKNVCPIHLSLLLTTNGFFSYASRTGFCTIYSNSKVVKILFRCIFVFLYI